MAADVPFMEVTGRKDVQNGGRSILKMTTSFGLFSSLSKVKICFFLLFTSNLSYFNGFQIPYKIRLLGFRSPLRLSKIEAKLESAHYFSKGPITNISNTSPLRFNRMQVKRKESLSSRSLRISLSCWLSTSQLSKMSIFL